MMIPEMNWARKLAPNRSPLRFAKSASTCPVRPNTRTSSCPVNASSISPLSSPVWRHCATNSFCERFAMACVIHSDTGMVSSAMIDSSGETTNIIASTPTIVSSEVSSWLRVCCRLVCTLSMSLVTRLSTSPRCWPSK